jgi:hypothetical protein
VTHQWKSKNYMSSTFVKSVDENVVTKLRNKWLEIVGIYQNKYCI